MYQEIAGMSVGKRTAVNNTFLSEFTNPVDIDDEERNFIAAMAEHLKLTLPDNFFDLGNLNKNAMSISLYSNPALNGTTEEINKYKKIKALHETISKTLEWAPVEKAFSGKLCLKLAVQNCGRAIDEDVEITLEIPQKSLLTLTEFPDFKNDEMGYLLNDNDMYELFGINGTDEYLDYSNSSKKAEIQFHTLLLQVSLDTHQIMKRPLVTH